MSSLILVYTGDPAAVNGANMLLNLYRFTECASPLYGGKAYQSQQVYLEFIHQNSLYIKNPNLREFDVIIFLSRHSGKSGGSRLTVHVPGNPGSEALYGGNLYELGFAAPHKVKAALQALDAAKTEYALDNWCVSLEGTHHGPTSLKAPVIFVEIGSSENEWVISNAGKAIARGAWTAAIGEAEGKNAVGFGGDHYCKRLTECILSNDLAIGHVFPRYYFAGLKEEVIVSAFQRTIGGCNLAVIDWKGLKGGDRSWLIKVLNKLDIDIIKY